MIRISQRQLVTIIALGAAALLAAVLSHFGIVGANGAATIVFVAALLAVLGGPSEGSSTEAFDSLRGAVKRLLEGKKPEPPLGSPLAVLQVYQELQEAHQTFEELSTRSNRNEAELQEAAVSLSAAGSTLTEGVAAQLNASDETAKYVKEVTNALREIAQHVEVLAANAEESSSSVLQMTATNEQVGGNILELAASVRETVASIEEMAYSIKEVAKNVDALSLTAEETSSSMNEMDVSIDQVQSNANETARLSEEVAQDAEKGAEAILKTIGEIYRIKESSQEAVAVISNLGSRIDAIGQILNVIDDVAEQTNLLALNAAIIAAQAGEHGKGFAVVAEEIKELAERTGASTKEIAELIAAVQAESQNARSAVEQGLRTVGEGVELGREAEGALKKISASASKSTLMVKAIARATVEQSRSSKSVTAAVQRIADAVEQVSRATTEQERGSAQMTDSARHMLAVTTQVERATEAQVERSRQIARSLSSIREMAGAVSRARGAQAAASERVLAAVEAIRTVAEAQVSSARQLEMVIEDLHRQAEVLRIEVQRFKV